MTDLREKISEIEKRNVRFIYQQRLEIGQSDPRFVSKEVMEMVDDVTYLLAHTKGNTMTMFIVQYQEDRSRIWPRRAPEQIVERSRIFSTKVAAEAYIATLDVEDLAEWIITEIAVGD